MHLRSGLGEPAAEIATDATRPIDGYAHLSPTPSARGPRQVILSLPVEPSQPRRTIRHLAQQIAVFILLPVDKAKPAASAPR
jgi:hypothetical protein